MQSIARLFIFLIITTFGLHAFGLQGQKITPLNEAFTTTITQQDSQITFNIDVAKDIYLYKNKVVVKDADAKPIALNLPEAQKYANEMVYFKNLNFALSTDQIQTETIELSFQGCAKAGICYPPVKKEFTVQAVKQEQKSEQPKEAGAKPKQSEEKQIASLIQDSNIFLVLATFFGFGLLLSLTPCIFPMIPILSSLIASQSGTMSAKRGFFLSLIYVLSMSVTYTIAGVLAGLFGANIQASFQNPWVITAFSAIFVILALSMFDYFKIELPHSLQNYFNKKSENASGNGLVSIAVMGFLSALIVGPCIAPPLAGALIYIGQTGDALLGGLALFFLSVGMGVPLLAIGTAAGKYMPKPGGWMQTVTHVFGVVMLGVAIWMLSRIMDDGVTMVLWALLALGSGIYIGALEPMDEKSDKHFIKKLVAFMIFLYGIALFFGAMSGGSNPLKPLENFGVANVKVEQGYEYESVTTIDELQATLQKSEKLTMVDFTAEWCVSCKELEAFTFKDPRVLERFKAMRIVKVDVTKNSDADKAMQSAFEVVGPPALIFYKEGKEIEGSRIVGYKNADGFLAHIKGL
jgi:thiol:disulfide interchange protein DsbD